MEATEKKTIPSSQKCGEIHKEWTKECEKYMSTIHVMYFVAADNLYTF